MTDQPALFDVKRLGPISCPVGWCQAILGPNQQRAITCAHDLEPEPGRRPRGCLNTVDPSSTPWPEGY